MKRTVIISSLLILLLQQGCMNPTAFDGTGSPKLILPGELKSLPQNSCLFSIGIVDQTNIKPFLSSGPLSAPTPSFIFLRKDGVEKEYGISTGFMNNQGLIGSAIVKRVPTRGQKLIEGKSRLCEQLLILNLSPGTYWVSGVAFQGLNGRCEISREQSQFVVVASDCQYLGRLVITIEKRESNPLWGDKLYSTGLLDKYSMQNADIAWAKKEYTEFASCTFSTTVK